MSDPEAFAPSDLASPQPATAPTWLSLLARGEEAFRPHPQFGDAPPPVPLPEEPVDDTQARVDEAFERGLAQGRAEAAAQVEAEMAERRRLGIALRRLEDDLTDEFAAMLAQTVTVLCEASFAPVALHSELLQTRCERAAAMLAEEQKGITLRLNPADIARLDDDFRAHWTIAPDPDLPQGELRVEGRDGAVLDGPQEWSRALQEALASC